MRLPRPRFTLRRLMIMVALLALGTWAFARFERSQIDYVAGWWDAECELWRGDASINSVGGCDLLRDICNIDRDTGLPFCRSGGCVIREGDLERMQGHNDHIEQYIRWHGLPRNTFKPWEDELFHLKQCFDHLSRADAPKRLYAGGPPMVSPDGMQSVQPVAVVKEDGSQGDSLKVVIASANVTLNDSYVRFGKEDSDLMWGPDGSRFVLIRSIFESTERYSAFDLVTGRLLRAETWYEGKPPGVKVAGKVWQDPYDARPAADAKEFWDTLRSLVVRGRN